MFAPHLAAILCFAVTVCLLCVRDSLFSDENGHLGSIIPILMILGPEIITKAMAITTASPRNDNPCFGFGMLAYVFKILAAAFMGTGELIPRPELDAKVVNLKSGQGRLNTSFVLSRVLRDLEPHHKDKKGSLVIQILKATAPEVPLSFAEPIA
jgi:hypothetical protein